MELAPSNRTTQLYIHLTGVAFRDEAQAAEDRLLCGTAAMPHPVEKAGAASGGTKESDSRS
jgi:hypothetical protein